MLLLFVCAILPKKAISEMTYTVSGGTLNPTHSLTLIGLGVYLLVIVSYFYFSLCDNICSFCAIFSPPKNDSFRKDLCFSPDIFFFNFFSDREISEMRGPTGLKFCTMVSTRPYFIMPVQNFGGCTPKKFRGQKHAKFGPISDDFEVRRRIYSKRMKTFKIGFLFRLLRFLLS